jgi:hypothetical protein
MKLWPATMENQHTFLNHSGGNVVIDGTNTGVK